MDVFSAAQSMVWGFILPWFYMILSAVLIIFIGIIVGRFVGRIAGRLLEFLGANELWKKATNAKIDIEGSGPNLVSYLIYASFIITALTQFGITIWVALLIMFGLLLVALSYLALGIQDAVRNTLAGLNLLKTRGYRKGDFVVVGYSKAQVMRIGLMSTRLLTKAGDTIYVPSSVRLKKVSHGLKKAHDIE